MASAAAAPSSIAYKIDQLERKMVELIQKNAVPIPPYPAVAARIRTVLAAPAYKVEDLVQLIGGDQSIAVQLLQIANSGQFAGMPKVTNLKAAILRIGEKEVQRIAVAASLASATGAQGPLIEIRRRTWRRAVLAGQLSQALAELYGLNKDDMFMLGLLHDFGAIVAITGLENVMAMSGSDLALEATQWQQLVDRYHVHLGMLVARRWSLPTQFCEVIATHHDDAPQGDHAAIARFIQRVDGLVGVIDSSVALAPKAFASLKLADKLVNDAIAAVPKILQQMSSFEPPAAPIARSAVLARPIHLGEPAKDLKLEATVVHQNTKAPIMITKAGPLGMLAVATTRFATTQVVKLTIEVNTLTKIDMFATAQLIEQRGTTLTYELTPFAQDQSVNREYLKWFGR